MDELPLKLHTENTYSKLINLSNECTSTTGCEINMTWNSPDDTLPDSSISMLNIMCDVCWNSQESSS
jgi:hypothetical protein